MNTTYLTVAGSGSATNVVVGPSTLTTAQIPAHTHVVGTKTQAAPLSGYFYGSLDVSLGATQTTLTADGGGGTTGLAHSHPGGSVSFTYNTTPKNMNVKYIDAIFATRNI
jgi:hypothetical protein